MLLYRYINNCTGPSIQQEQFTFSLKTSTQTEADSTHNIRINTMCLICCTVRAKCRNAVDSCCQHYISLLLSLLYAIPALVMFQPEGKERKGRLQNKRHQKFHINSYLPIRKRVSQIGHSLKVYIAEFRKATSKLNNRKEKRVLLSLLGGHNHQAESKAYIKHYLSDTYLATQ